MAAPDENNNTMYDSAGYAPSAPPASPLGVGPDLAPDNNTSVAGSAPATTTTTSTPPTTTGAQATQQPRPATKMSADDMVDALTDHMVEMSALTDEARGLMYSAAAAVKFTPRHLGRLLQSVAKGNDRTTIATIISPSITAMSALELKAILGEFFGGDAVAISNVTPYFTRSLVLKSVDEAIDIIDSVPSEARAAVARAIAPQLPPLMSGELVALLRAVPTSGGGRLVVLESVAQAPNVISPPLDLAAVLTVVQPAQLRGRAIEAVGRHAGAMSFSEASELVSLMTTDNSRDCLVACKVLLNKIDPTRARLVEFADLLARVFPVQDRVSVLMIAVSGRVISLDWDDVATILGAVPENSPVRPGMLTVAATAVPGGDPLPASTAAVLLSSLASGERVEAALTLAPRFSPDGLSGDDVIALLSTVSEAYYQRLKLLGGLVERIQPSAATALVQILNLFTNSKKEALMALRPFIFAHGVDPEPLVATFPTAKAQAAARTALV